MRSQSHVPPVLVWLPVLVATAAAVAVEAAQAVDHNVEVITATTVNMDPAGQDLKFDILRWSSDDDRQAVIGLLMHTATEQGEHATLSDLIALPSLGSVWLAESGLGYSLKYAHRVVTPDGGERLTFVTGRRLGAFNRTPWTSTVAPGAPDRPFTVIDLRLDGSGEGEGTMSLAADIVVDEKTGTVGLANYDTAPVLLESVKRQPPRYSGA